MKRVLLRRIACAVDQSEHSAALLRRTLVLASLHDAEVTVLHVTDRPRLQPGSVQRTAEDLFSNLRRLTQSLIERGSVRWVLAHGNPATEVARYVRSAHADLVVLGRSSSRPATGMVGTVAEAVLRGAICPILVMPRATHRDAPSEPPFREILCGVCSGLSRTTLRHALSLAQEFESRLTILNVDHDHRANPDHPAVQSEIQRLRVAIPDTANEWCEIDEFVTAGDPAMELTRAADRLDADLVVVGASVVPVIGQGLGSAALGALALTRAHVLVVPIPESLRESSAARRLVHT